MMEGLRQRSTQQAQPESTDRAFNMQQIKDMQNQIAPIFVTLASFLKSVEPIADKVSEILTTIWAALQPYHPEDLAVAAYGLALVFFGGIYMTIVASCEAAHQFGWERIKSAISALHHEWTKARIAFERDNKRDSDRDGVADVAQMDAQTLAARRLMILTRSINPENLSMALEGLTMATIAILATLRVRFAKAITLGTALGEVLDKMFSPFTTQLLEYALPDDYEKWIPILNKYGFRYIGLSASWILMRVMTSIFAAMRGSSLFITGLCGYLQRHNYVGPNVFKEGNPLLVAAWGFVAFIGMYMQISTGFTIPFPLNIIFLPVTLLEQLIIAAVGVSAS